MRRLATLLATTAFLVACQGQPANLLTDPKAILEAAAASAATASTVHIDIVADGPISFDPLGTGAGTAVNLKGTNATIDADLAGGRLHATFLSPNLLNLAADVITIDGATYFKSSLTGAKYLRTSTAVPSGASAMPSAAASQALSGLTEILRQPGLQPVKGDDVPCAGGTCYTVTLQVTSAQLQSILGSSAGSIASSSPGTSPNASTGPSASAGSSGGSGGVGDIPGVGGLPGIGGAISGLSLPDLSTASADLAIHVEQASNRLSGIDATLHLGDTGDPKLTFTFTKWNEPVTIEAPPADQVQPAG